jgi:hypothetical protein
MKVKGRDEAGPARPAPDKGRFQQALQQAGKEAARAPGRPGTPPPKPGVQLPGTPTRVATGALPRGAQVAAGPVRLVAGGTFASAEHLGQVRQRLHQEGHRLGEVRSESHQVNQERVEQRVADLLSRELAREQRAESAPRSAPTLPSAEGPAAPSSSARETSSSGEEPRAGGPGEASPAAGDTTSPEARIQAAMELVERIEVFVKSQRPALAMRLGGALEATVEVERTGVGEVAVHIQGHRGPLRSEDLARIREALEARGLRLRTLLTS